MLLAERRVCEHLLGLKQTSFCVNEISCQERKNVWRPFAVICMLTLSLTVSPLSFTYKTADKFLRNILKVILPYF